MGLRKDIELPNNTVLQDLEACRATLEDQQASLRRDQPPTLELVFAAYRRSDAAIEAMFQLKVWSELQPRKARHKRSNIRGPPPCFPRVGGRDD